MTYDTTRRGFLRRALTTTGIALTVPTIMGTAMAQDDSDPFSPGAHVYNVDRGRYSERDMVIKNDPDPAQNRGFVVHVTSNEKKTRDYAALIMPTGGLALGQLDSVSYEYYEQPNNTTAAPDEVWLLIVTGAQESRKTHIIGQSFNDGQTVQTWKKRDVYKEMTGEIEYNGWVEAVSTQNVVERGPNLIEEFGEHARLLRIAIGIGGAITMEKTVTNLFLDNFVINGDTKGLPTTQ